MTHRSAAALLSIVGLFAFAPAAAQAAAPVITIDAPKETVWNVPTMFSVQVYVHDDDGIPWGEPDRQPKCSVDDRPLECVTRSDYRPGRDPMKDEVVDVFVTAGPAGTHTLKVAIDGV